MGFVQVDEVSHDAGNPADVYAEGWQTWSRPRMKSTFATKVWR